MQRSLFTLAYFLLALTSYSRSLFSCAHFLAALNFKNILLFASFLLGAVSYFPATSYFPITSYSRSLFTRAHFLAAYRMFGDSITPMAGAVHTKDLGLALQSWAMPRDFNFSSETHGKIKDFLMFSKDMKYNWAV